ncbi:hydroxyisourate hydrolase [Psychrobacter sp.]|uniref:hydroxyisourate hydrolase n=1 Tax=Psychrobacter sp. TaxID=56811 RepID=UPI0025D61C04|nr:hydroxyisourate hydrolase [Psychrobacter sp.]
MTATLSSHVLDTHLGKPACGIKVTLHFVEGEDIDNATNISTTSACTSTTSSSTTSSTYLAEAVTNVEGRISINDWHVNNEVLNIPPGNYTLTFETSNYFKDYDVEAFYPKVVITFIISDQSHYHIPLLISAHGYSTYRGS